jgi:asparagine synthase (glutamine-hydrolysing)
MCGLFGHFSPLPVSDQQEQHDCLLNAQHALHHRGPDDSGLETLAVPSRSGSPAGSLSLGHTRLSIIDLSPGGHQPMQSANDRYRIVFNGEIYNYRELRQELKGLGHRFQTDSDTEVLLAAWAQWGESGLRRLTGMFAFAVFDRHKQTLTLVRDAFGIKPLFFRLERNALHFASEMPALLALLPAQPELNYQRAYDYLVWGQYDNSRETFYQGIEHLEPGHVLRVDLQQLAAGQMVERPRRWWWPSISERTDLSFEDAAAQLREMFLNSVRLHLRSDVPVGAALSGGVDSSAVVCAMRHLEPDMPIHTFSYVARGSAVDEEAWVDIVNTHVGAIAHKVVVEPDDLAGDLNDMIRAQGEPFGGTSIYAQYRVFKAAREAGIVVTMAKGQMRCWRGMKVIRKPMCEACWSGIVILKSRFF